jgi:hypothetical protein
MNFMQKIIIAFVSSIILLTVSQLIFDMLDIEKYIYMPYVSWIILIIILFLLLPQKGSTIFDI